MRHYAHSCTTELLALLSSRIPAKSMLLRKRSISTNTRLLFDSHFHRCFHHSTSKSQAVDMSNVFQESTSKCDGKGGGSGVLAKELWRLLSSAQSRRTTVPESKVRPSNNFCAPPVLFADNSNQPASPNIQKGPPREACWS